MDTCFLFSHELDTEGCLCLKMSPDGDLLLPLAKRSFDDIKAMQIDCSTIIVESSENACMLELELAWLPDRKARIAIPYALEDKLAQPVDEMHFGFDKLRYNDKRYLVTVISKSRMQSIMQSLADNDISYNLITVDWFALSFHQLIVSGSVLLINTDEFKGALSAELADSYLKNHPLNTPLRFTDSAINLDQDIETQDEDSRIWIAKRLLHGKPLNLCQGEMQHNSDDAWIKKGYQLVAALGLFWLVSLLVVNGISLYSVSKKSAKVDAEIAVIYHQFFPEAKQVISPKFRITQLLSTSNAESQAHFWFLLGNFAKAMENSKLTVDQLRYQNKVLLATVASADFPNLQKLENALRSKQIKVKQLQASTKDQQVVATLELT